jgi:hypothetical protein
MIWQVVTNVAEMLYSDDGSSMFLQNTSTYLQGVVTYTLQTWGDPEK